MKIDYVQSSVAVAAIYWPLLVVIVVWAGVLWVAFRPVREPLQKIVWDNLDSAYRGGHFEPPATGGYYCGMSADAIAYDLTLHAEDCEGWRPEDLAPYVRRWLDKMGLSQ